MTSPQLWSIAYFSALIICGKPVVPSVSETPVSIRRIFAPGAIAWAYSTSSVVSPAQPVWSGFFGSKGGTLPPLHHGDMGVGQAELLVEGVQVALDGRRAEGVDDHDRPALAGDARLVDRAQVVRLAVLERRVATSLNFGLARQALVDSTEPIPEASWCPARAGTGLRQRGGGRSRRARSEGRAGGAGPRRPAALRLPQ